MPALFMEFATLLAELQLCQQPSTGKPHSSHKEGHFEAARCLLCPPAFIALCNARLVLEHLPHLFVSLSGRLSLTPW